MSEWDAAALLEPLSAESPCGENLSDSAVLNSLDALRLYGRTLSVDVPEAGDADAAKPPVDWGAVRSISTEALGRTKDLRILAYLATAFLRTDGLVPFTRALGVAAHWLDSQWATVYPLVDEDALERRNALNNLSDLMAVVDRLRRIPLVESRKYGRFALRDIELAGGQLQPLEGETRPDEVVINAAFGEASTEELTALADATSAGVDALKAIETRMGTEGGPDMIPSFGPLTTQLVRIRRIVQEKVAQRTPAVAPEDEDAAGGGEAGPSAYRGGAVRSREEAIRALDAVAEFFRKSEPSSPIPLIVERAKRLVSMDFLELLADIAPDAVATARSAAGLKDS